MWPDEEGGAFELGTDGPKVILVGWTIPSPRCGPPRTRGRAGPRQGGRLVVVYVEQLSAIYGAAAALPGAGPACGDLCWYLALNQARLPEHKEAVTSRLRAALEDHGIRSGSWWHEQLDLCMIGVVATFGWEKALGDGGELSWWEATAVGVDRRPGRLMPMAPRV